MTALLHWPPASGIRETRAMRSRRLPHPRPAPSPAFAGYLFRAIDQFGQVIDVFRSPLRDAKAARRFFSQAIDRTRTKPVEVTTDRYRAYSRVLEELLPAAFHDTGVHANNPIETDHGRLK